MFGNAIFKYEETIIHEHTHRLMTPCPFRIGKVQISMVSQTVMKKVKRIRKPVYYNFITTRNVCYTIGCLCYI